MNSHADNELPLAIWTPIKGYGQVSRPFQGVCTQMWQNAVASVSTLTSCSKCRGCHVIVPSSAAPTPPLLLLTLCLMLFQRTVRQTQKQENAELFFSLFLGCGPSLPHFSAQPNVTPLCSNKLRRYCGDKQSWSAAKNNSRRRRATPPFFSPLWFSDPPLLTSPHSLSRSTFASSSFHFQSSDVSSGFPPPANLKE